MSVGIKIGGLRIGFASYSNNYWHRRTFRPRFSYPFYCYDPYAPQVVVVASPWYGYSYLPPYLDGSRVTYVDSYPAWDWDRWDRYDPADDRADPDVRDAVADLRDAFEDGDDRIVDHLLPQEGDVAILNEGKYDYSLNPDDFQKMFLDGIEDSKTVRYEILDVKTRGDEVRIRARHTFTDSWDKEDSVVHLITLRRGNGGDYVIREFGTE
ncbi:hypothetical protein BH11ARM2_BH11ARM2_37550 [soil metagenome]